MTWSHVLSSPLFAGLVLVVVGAVVSATAASTRATHPRLSAWLSALAAALPADVTRMSPGAAPKPTEPPATGLPPVLAPPVVDREAETAKERRPESRSGEGGVG